MVLDYGTLSPYQKAVELAYLLPVCYVLCNGMTIAVLPQNTVIAIGSSQILTDSASLVKELLENAIDAKASSILIEVSPNCLDVIQVKDNGHGVPPEDRALLCRRSCTSKIRGLEDLASLGGTYLGFRGEALASAVELSGALTISTKIDYESVAALIRYNRQGEVMRYCSR